MDIFMLLSLIGGLALFLFGMNVMGDGLTKASGGKLEQILEKLTSTPIKGVILGAAVTGVIQSSSATTVMVVGFVNSGIMKLSQTVGIIMGANIGTTVTSWILSLSGIQSDNLFMKLLEPTSFSPILAIIGVIITMISKNEKKKNIASILIGFAVLMFGMDMMSSAVEPLKDVPEFVNILTMFSNPLLGMLAGLVLTAIIQSSSASVGILQALCATGAVSFGSAIPIIMGQNIGTCVTAIISSIGASKNAKRTALIHLYFNVIGTTIYMIVFYSINAFVHFDFLTDAASPAGIAVVHSTFNIAATIVLLPFNKQLVKLAARSIPGDDSELEGQKAENEEVLKRLDPRFLEQAGLAVGHCLDAAVEMAKLTGESMTDAMSLLDDYNKDTAKKVVELEHRVDHYEDVIGSYLIQIPTRAMTESDNAKSTMILHCLNDLERISDYSVNVQRTARELAQKETKLSFEGHTEMLFLRKAVSDILSRTVQALETDDRKLAKEIEPMQEALDDLTDELRRRHIDRLREGRCTMELGIALEDLITYMERVAGHCSNIGISILESSGEQLGQHAYLKSMRIREADFFRERYEYYRELYAYPEA